MILMFGFWILNSNGYAEIVSSRDLIEGARRHDGRIITYQGEAIGDIMKRGNFSWINISDADNAIGAWVPNDLVDEITLTGDYKHMGDYVEIIGEFHRACAKHNGELDIHVENLIILKKGQEREEIVSPVRKKAAFVFLGVAVCLGILKLLISKYKKT